MILMITIKQKARLKIEVMKREKSSVAKKTALKLQNEDKKESKRKERDQMIQKLCLNVTVDKYHSIKYRATLPKYEK